MKLITLGRLEVPEKKIDYNESIDPWSLTTNREQHIFIIPWDRPSLLLDHLAAAEERARARRRAGNI